MSIPIPLTSEVGWINECFPLGDEHLHVSVYLIQDGRNNIIIDSGSFYHRETIKQRLQSATQEIGITALILSHSDYPHSANISPFRKEWGDFPIIASSASPEIQGLPYATKSTIGEIMEIGGRPFSFIDPPLADRSHTTWVYDHGSGVLFTADGFGNHHRPGECDLTTAGMPDGIAAQEIHRFHREALPWLRYVDPAKLKAKLEGMLHAFDVSYIAPIHGNPIARKDIPTYLTRLIEAAGYIAGSYLVPAI